MCVLTVFMLSIFPSGAMADIIDWKDKDQLEPSNPVGDEDPFGEYKVAGISQTNPPTEPEIGPDTSSELTDHSITTVLEKIICAIFDIFKNPGVSQK